MSKKIVFPNTLIPILNYRDNEIPLQDVISIAFDAHTPDATAKHYQEKLNTAYKMINEDPNYWHRIIFLEDQQTSQLKIWFD